MADAEVKIMIDPFTLAHPDYPVDARVKSVPVTSVSVPLWGTVVRNDGETFDVSWDFVGFTSTGHSLVGQAEAARKSVTALGDAALANARKWMDGIRDRILKG
jgi:hypothetical protein